jgi:guanine nucleotide-binding protein alpha-1 subunit
LLHTPSAFHAERIAWRFVIYLNLVRSIRRILEATAPNSEPLYPHVLDDVDDESAESASVIISPYVHVQSPPASHHFTKVYEAYQTRLSPLVALEQRLIAQLSDEELNEEREATRLGTPNGAWHPLPNHSSDDPKRNPKSVLNLLKTIQTSPASMLPELSVRTTSNWKKALALSGMMKSSDSPQSGELVGWWEDPGDPVHVIHQCGPAMQDLWNDPMIKQRLAERRLRLEESGGL